ncbi:protein-L-isoaspartate O-methyltransferase domain-containing protein 2-like [Dreissena polymorpha]|uniref:SOCS box domain-containing protein n=1 Tax=Dreissena polymorpha TaxID=45954 RepID=A0A9D4EB07_DREPO|nr:protein-L-isoaspartate O-methyltransferase domain-containing protein 2-like [Dreissena polymorpha]XP_052230520.1 protein-L-isoaspartate O-methyltransferase domain-containing protein 2-like [Dreissena polymorpha]XP_052230521.1 protein-L-isoaspartate O-methyltransferase domain-containing protein 2-like [Dreissena polymorpha]KAH3775649.1 hypothetical protein DPMN_177055 [Dreissena polymorpha]
MGGAVSTGRDNDELVDNLKDAEYIKSQLVEDVFRAVDRADYYLPGHKEAAYKDLAWRHDHLHLSAPCIYSEVMEALQLKPGLSFLNLGSGLGYLSTMVGLILGPYGVNHGVEQFEDVVQYAEERLSEFLKRSPAVDKFEFCMPKFIVGNCLNLNPGHLYDRVYVGAGCPPEHENYMKNLLKVGGILVMPLNDRLIQAKRESETEWSVTNKLPVSFATLASPPLEPLPDLIDLPEALQPNLQELCRCTVRRVLRSNIYKRHPDLTKVHKRRKKQKPEKRSHGAMSNMSIMPFSMGMMILHQLDRDSDSDNSMQEHYLLEEEGDESPDHSRDLDRDSGGEPVEIESDVEEEEARDIAQDATFSTDDEGDVRDKNAACNNDDKHWGQEHKTVDDIASGEVNETNGKQMLDNGPKDAKDDGSEKDDEKHSDYASDEEHDNVDNDVIQEVKEANRVASKNNEQNGHTDAKMFRINDFISNVVSSSNNCMPGPSEDVTPPDADWSDNSDEGEDRQYNVEEFIKQGARSTAPKQRYSSTTSVDTSTTSGIGSFVEEHFDLEMGGRSFGEKTSCLFSPVEEPHSSRQRRRGNMDIEEDLEEDGQEEDVSEPIRASLTDFMREDIDTLPLPLAMKSFLKYYRH